MDHGCNSRRCRRRRNGLNNFGLRWGSRADSMATSGHEFLEEDEMGFLLPPPQVDLLLVPSLRDEMLTITNFSGHPWLTDRLAVANPIPVVPPVTSPIFPSSLPIFISPGKAA